VKNRKLYVQRKKENKMHAANWKANWKIERMKEVKGKLKNRITRASTEEQTLNLNDDDDDNKK